VARLLAETSAKDRERLLARIAANLESEALAGRAKEPGNRAAARLWIVMSERVVPDADLAFLRRLCERSIELARADLGRGYRSRRQALDANPPRFREARVGRRRGAPRRVERPMYDADGPPF
jgi:hypothetical protein